MPSKPVPSHSSVERAGWFTQHPVREEPVHVVTREWFDEIKAERDDLREEVELAAEQGRLVGLEAERYRHALNMAIYHADNLQRYIDRKPVRDLAESRAGLEAAREVFEEAESA